MNPVYAISAAHAARGRGMLFRWRPAARAALIALLTCLLCSMARAQSETPAHIIAAARRALPHLADAQDWSHTLMTDVRTTALGCRPMRGLQLPQAIEVYRLRLIDRDQQVLLHVSADGTMTQQCADDGADARAGLIYTSISSVRDRDGDSLADNLDACPSIAGLPGADPPGCPQASRGDSDGDGSANGVDACPRQAGSAAVDGCSLFLDEDGDGVPDTEDICPRDFGVIRSDFALGCPADGSGNSTKPRDADENCAFQGVGVPLYDGPSLAASVNGTISATADESAEVIGRDATGFWYQIQRGWLPGSAIELRGACYNMPLVNVAPGANTGCYLRPREATVNVRRAPRDKQVARISPENSYAVLGQNLAGDWLFFRQGWVSLSVLELAGDCSRLPVLDPAKASSGTVHFCPPLYRGFLIPRIDIGQTSARVASRTLANRLRAGPGLSAQQIGEIPPRQVLDAVLDGPACDGAFVWWLVEVNGVIGWTVESDLNANAYYLEPLAAPVSQESAPASGQSLEEAPTDAAMMISSPSLDRLDRTHVIPADDPLQVAWSPGNQSLAVLLADGALQFYRYPGFDPLPVYRYPADGFAAASFAFSPVPDAADVADVTGVKIVDKLALGGRDGRVSVLTLAEDASVSTLLQLSPSLPGAVRALDWSPDGGFLAAASGGGDSKLAGPGGELIVWKINDVRDAPSAEASLRFAFPYPLTDIAFSANGRWLALAGESVASRRAALWVYDAADGRLVFSKALIGMAGEGLLRASPSADLADFFYSNGDSLYLLDIDTGQDLRFYHRAGAIMPQLDIRRRVVGGAEMLLAIASQDANGQAQLHFVNPMNSDSPTAHLPIALDDLAFSPDGRAIALAQRSRDRVLILSIAPE
ncbi:MAG: thrombospondin type 3 repeat-containing protein [Chloroflexota bacterium]|nr:thrombospondin type 3 repeat-containing protein [Chloroflexota bacterium]